MSQATKNSYQFPNKEPSSRELNLFAMTKQSLIKKIHILTHQLSIHHAYQLQREALLNYKDETIKMELIERGIVIDQMKKNMAVMQNCHQEKSTVIEQLTEEKVKYELSIKNLMRQNQLINKKLVGLQKAKSREIAQKLDQKQRTLKGKTEALLEQNRKMKMSIQEMRNKIKILTDLNAQTEDKLAQALSQVISNHPKSKKGNQKENMNQNIKADLKQESNNLREQIRKVRAQLKDSQQARERLRHKLKQRQQFYSKMLASKDIQQ